MYYLIKVRGKLEYRESTDLPYSVEFTILATDPTIEIIVSEANKLIYEAFCQGLNDGE